ncbi:MAG: hypothetical protein M3541_18165 [Acidobacteriota bacterium]|nr:hypothetical protein [Acidobacteriota bacterium]
MSRRFLRPPLAFGPANSGAPAGVDERIVAGQVRHPFAQARVDESARLGMRVQDGVPESITTALSQFVFHSLGDEPAAIPLDFVYLVDESAGGVTVTRSIAGMP